MPLVTEITNGLGDPIKLWEAASGRALLTLKSESDFVYSAVLSPDCKLMAISTKPWVFEMNQVGLEDAYVIELKETQSGQVLATLQHPDLKRWAEDKSALIFSPDGSLL